MKHTDPHIAVVRPPPEPMLFDELYKTEVFKRGHLVALSGVNENTLKVYLPFLHQASKRVTAERKASRFTPCEAMAVMVMAEFQREWGMRPEFSFMAAWMISVGYCHEIDLAMKDRYRSLEFPKLTFTVSFSPVNWLKARPGILPDHLGVEIDQAYQDDLFSFIGIKDSVMRERVFEPMADLYETVTGNELIWKFTLGDRRDDELAKP